MKLSATEPIPSICLISSDGNIIIYKVEVHESMKPIKQYMINGTRFKIRKSLTWKILSFNDRLAYFISDDQIVILDLVNSKPIVSTFESPNIQFTNFKYNQGREIGYAITKDEKLLQIDWEHKKTKKIFDMSKEHPGSGVKQVLFFTVTSRQSYFFVIFNNLELRMYNFKKWIKATNSYKLIYKTSLKLKGVWEESGMPNA